MNKRPPNSVRDQEFRAIEEQAAEWFGRCELGLTPKQEQAFLRWLEADPRHGMAMRDMDTTWVLLDGLKDVKLPVPTTASASAHRWRAGKRAAWSTLFTAAAALIIAGVGIWQPWKESAVVRQAATEAGGMKKMELPDGSIIHLNASSGVVARFTRDARQVQLLRGEAHFTVAKDPARPFVVIAGDVDVKAVGTVFNVRIEEKAVEVFVTEGKVRLGEAGKGDALPIRMAEQATVPPGAPLTAEKTPKPVANQRELVAGQRAFVPLAKSPAPPVIVVAPIAPKEIQQALAWQARQLDFDMTPLSQVVADFNRFNTHQLVIADSDLGRQPFGGSFRADNYSVFVQLLEQRFGVAAERAKEKTILRRAK